MLPGFAGEAAAEGDLLDPFDELARPALVHDAQLPVLDRGHQAAGGEGAGEHHLAGVLADVDEPAGAGQPRRRSG